MQHSITQPETSGVYYSDQLITFEGVVSDGEDTAETLTVWWESSLDGDLDVEASPNSEGAVDGSGYLSEGEHYLRLYAEDSDGKTGSDNLTLQVGPPNSAPSCAITAPESGSSGPEGEEVLFEGESWQSLGYITIPLKTVKTDEITVQLAGAQKEEDGFNDIVEVDPNKELDLFKDDKAAAAKGQLRIVEIEFYEKL